VNEENEKEDGDATQKLDLEDQYSLKNLLKLYREAILHLNQRTISEVESEIAIVDTKNTKLLQKVAALSTEITSGKEKYIRLQADFENARKRLEKSRFRVRSDTKGEVIERLLPMVDGFEKVKQQIKPETEKEKKIDASYQGIYKQFVEIMKSLQVAAVPTVGKPFDPTVSKLSSLLPFPHHPLHLCYLLIPYDLIQVC
ncbi:Protein GrpE, partial [Linum perenne]